MLDNSGNPIDADFSVDQTEDGVLSVVLESRGGGRNDDYAAALTLILERLGDLGATIEDILEPPRDCRRLISQRE